jgi:hypothetical protein
MLDKFDSEIRATKEERGMGNCGGYEDICSGETDIVGGEVTKDIMS